VQLPVGVGELTGLVGVACVVGEAVTVWVTVTVELAVTVVVLLALSVPVVLPLAGGVVWTGGGVEPLE
jgi:hypothetical protein